MNAKDAKELYEGKYFYEIVKTEGHILLLGPFDDIYYAWPQKAGATPDEYSFIQVVNSEPVMAFTKEEILVTDRIL